MIDGLTADRAMPDAAARLPAGEMPETDQSSRAGPLVCVVDDDEFVRDSLRALLESFGFGVATYACGRDILGDGRRHLASCFIVDHHMPGMDGLAALEALRRDDPNVPTILVTGRLDADIAARAAALEVDAILEKPFSAARLFQVIDAHRAPSQVLSHPAGR
jgi:two-component system, LuxR family, response regulator FixJ